MFFPPSFQLANVGHTRDAQLLMRLLRSGLLVACVVTLLVLLLVTPLTVGDIMASTMVFIPTGWGLLQVEKLSYHS